LAGIAVDVMVSDRGEGLNQTPYWAANTYLAEVAAAGARVHLYGKGYLHAKTLSIDGEVCSIGSANLDIRSFSINYELNAVIYDARLAQALEAAFERDLEDCYPFEPAEYRRSPVLKRLRDSTARLLSPLL
jgi:cardiolipin synthase A/B